MPAYKLKSLLYLLVFIFCAWLYYQADTQSSETDKRPVAKVAVSQAQPEATAANGL